MLKLNLILLLLVVITTNALCAEEPAPPPGLTREQWASHLEWAKAEFQRHLDEQRIAHKRDKKLIVVVTIYPNPPEFLTVGYEVRADRTLTEFHKNIRFDENHGALAMPPAATRNLHMLLAKLPPTEGSASESHLIISFLRRGRWITRTYTGKKNHDTLQAIIGLPSKYNVDGFIPGDYILPR